MKIWLTFLLKKNAFSNKYVWDERNQEGLAQVFLQFINNTSNNHSNTD
jgi:hypothetical protein